MDRNAALNHTKRTSRSTEVDGAGPSFGGASPPSSSGGCTSSRRPDGCDDQVRATAVPRPRALGSGASWQARARSWVSAELRRRRGSCVVLAVLIGCFAGAAIASIAGARRTDTAYERFRDEARARDLPGSGRRRRPRNGGRGRDRCRSGEAAADSRRPHRGRSLRRLHGCERRRSTAGSSAASTATLAPRSSAPAFSPGGGRGPDRPDEVALNERAVSRPRCDGR